MILIFSLTIVGLECKRLSRHRLLSSLYSKGIFVSINVLILCRNICLDVLKITSEQTQNGSQYMKQRFLLIMKQRFFLTFRPKINIFDLFLQSVH